MKTRLHYILTSGLFTSILLLLFLGSSHTVFSQTTVTLTTADNGTQVTIPANATNVIVECWGAGGSGAGGDKSGGNNVAGGGGGGGEYSRSINISPGTYSFQVGAGAPAGPAAGNGSQGTSSSFDSGAVLANGGGGGIHGGAGGAGGTGGVGNDANISGTNGSAVAGTTGGDGGTGANGGAGGTGSIQGIGTPGSIPGGGGGGGSGKIQTGGAGANGQIIITYTVSNDTCPESTSIEPTGAQILCQGDASSLLTATITNTTGGSGTPTHLYQWYYNSDANPTNTIASATLIAGATSSTYTPLTTASEIGTRYYFCVGYATDNNCAQTNADQTLASTNIIQVTVNATPSVPTGTPSQTFCAIDNPTVASLSATGTSIQWYSASTGGTALLSTVALADGTHYYASQTVSGCESDTRFDVTVTVNDPPAPTGTAAQTYCAIDNPTVASLSATGTSIQWYSASTGGAALLSTVALADGTHYYASQTVSGCESDTRFDVTVTVDDPAAPTGSASQTFCSGDSPTVANLVATGTVIQWYSVPSGGSPLGGATALADATIYYASQTVNTCESTSRLAVTATVKDVPALPVIAGTTPVVEGNNYTYSIDLVADATNYTWNWPSAPGAWTYVSGQDTNSLIVTAGSQGGDITVIVTNSCGDSDLASFTVTIGVAPECPTSTNILNPDPQTVCEDVATSQLTANINGAGSYTPLYQWYYNTTTNTNDPNHADANLIAGATSASYTPLSTASEIGTRYYFCVGYATDAGCTQTNDDIALASTPVIITVNATPLAPGTSPVTYCEGDAASALTATGTNLLWYTVPTGGTGSATAPTPSTVSAGTTPYYVSQTVSNCEGPRASLIVTVNAPPTTANAGDNQNISVATATLAANVAVPVTTGTGVWSVTSGPNTSASQFSSTSDNTAIFTPAGGVGDYVLRWTISNAPCTDSWSEVTITTTYTPSNPPTITFPDPNPLAMQGGNSTNLIYIATTNNPDKYSITYDATALGQGFLDVPIATDLPPSPIALFVPSAAILGTYNGVLTVKNSITGLTSGDYPITITITNVTDHSLYNCSSCHITHNAPGTTLTTVDGNALLCQSCHISTGAASARPLVDGIKLTNSHSWDVPAANSDYETVAPDPTSAMGKRLPEGNIICSTCHNQHSNGAADSPYLRVDNTGDAMCKVCHAERDVGIYSAAPATNRGSHPVGVTYDDTDTRFNNTQTLVTNGSMVQCSTCHGVHDVQTPSVNNLTTDGNLLRMTNDVNLCTDCHNYSDHMGMTCLDCHEVHNTVDGTVDNNIFMIKSSIATPFSGNKPVIFTAESGFNSFADGLGAATPGNEVFDGVCEVCHAPSSEGGKPVSHFVNDGSGSDQYHDNQSGQSGANCTTCHSHSDGFIPSGGSCHGCHDATPGAFKYPLASEGYTEGSHPLHVGTYEFTCDTCHYLQGSGGANEGSHPSGTKDIIFNPSGLASANGSTPSWDGTTCSNVYCHSDGGASDGSTITYVQTPNWIGGSVSCGDCHTVPSTNGAHTTHTSAPYNFACTTCHVGINGTTDPPTANHINGTLGPEEFDPGGMATANGATPSWDVATSTCSSVYCHSDGNGTYQPTPPDWYTGAVACGDCHTVTPSSGAHSRHTDGVMYNFACATCHNGAIVPSDPPSTGHINGSIGPEFDLSGLATRNGNDANTPVFNGDKTCDNVFCHSHGESAEGTSTGNTQRDGTTPLGITWEIAGTVPRTPPALPTFVTTPAWDTGTLPTCGGCHLGSLTPSVSTTDWPQSGQHTGKGAHLVTCWWCHNTIGDQTYIGTYGTTKHVDGNVWFIPELFSDGGTFHNLPVPTGGDGNTASSGHCGDPGGGGKTCWY